MTVEGNPSGNRGKGSKWAQAAPAEKKKEKKQEKEKKKKKKKSIPWFKHADIR